MIAELKCIVVGDDGLPIDRNDAQGRGDHPGTSP